MSIVSTIKESTSNQLPVELFSVGHSTLNLAVQPIFSQPYSPFTHFMHHWFYYNDAMESLVNSFAEVMVNNIYYPLLDL